jgi:GNAT superfamily N-acetyltransferase
MELSCFECGLEISAPTVKELGDSFLDHARATHDWPYPDQAVRNYADATQRLTGASEREDEIGPITIRKVGHDEIEDWLEFFDHDAFVGTPEWAACYCLEPHVRVPDAPPDAEVPSWIENRSDMLLRLENGASFGYLAYEKDRPIGWVNASKRSDYTLYQNVDPTGPDSASVIGVSCFIIAPPFRRHQVAARLLDRVIEDAPSRGADWIEAYPFTEAAEADNGNFRGPIGMYRERGFETVTIRDRDTVMRRPVV